MKKWNIDCFGCGDLFLKLLLTKIQEITRVDTGLMGDCVPENVPESEEKGCLSTER